MEGKYIVVHRNLLLLYPVVTAATYRDNWFVHEVSGFQARYPDLPNHSLRLVLPHLTIVPEQNQ